MNLIQSSLKLPCGAEIKNRIGKSAMTERIADSNNFVNQKHLNLYQRWSEGECGLLISGNVMVDRFNLEGAGNIILDQRNYKDKLETSYVYDYFLNIECLDFESKFIKGNITIIKWKKQ